MHVAYLNKEPTNPLTFVAAMRKEMEISIVKPLVKDILWSFIKSG